MARQPSPKSSVTKVRFMLLEAEGTESDLSQIFSAIQSAAKPTTTIIQQRFAPASSAARLTIGEAGDSDAEEIEDFEIVVSEDVPQSVDKVVRGSKPRKYPTPQVLHDADLTLGVSFEEFANAKKPDNDKDRFLVAACWWAEQRNEQAIGINHVYTCYKKMRWPSAIVDFAWPLRSLKKDGSLRSAGRGLYAINHIGSGRVEKMGEA